MHSFREKWEDGRTDERTDERTNGGEIIGPKSASGGGPKNNTKRFPDNIRSNMQKMLILSKFGTFLHNMTPKGTKIGRIWHNDK